MRVQTKNAHVHRKRHGHHQKRSSHFMKVYTPYLPLTILVALSVLMSTIPTTKSHSEPQSVLAYATEMSVSGLLGSTNQQRSNNGVASLAVNGKLNAAAQAKANDMVNRDYWAHNTPDGSPPWVFITNAGYSYSRAGENLAYGYSTSANTVNGWMGSPSHRDNMLNSNFIDVGFGIANGANYTGDPQKGPPGPQTIVVAMYAAPYTPPAASQNSTKPSTTAQQPKKTTPAPTVPETTEPAQSTPEEEQKEETVATTKEETKPPLINGNTESKSSSRLDLFTNNKLPWLGSLLLVLSVVGGLIVLTRHGLAFQKLIVRGEQYVLHHTLFDVTIISLAVFCYMASRSVGVIL